MAKATLLNVTENNWESTRRFECVADDQCNGTVWLYYELPGDYRGDWIPKVGDRVQYFGEGIVKIVSRPVQYYDGNKSQARWKKSIKREGTKMRHSVNVKGMDCGRFPSAYQLERGALFAYPQGSCIYMKLKDVNQTCSEQAYTQVVQLETGTIYDIPCDKPLKPLEPGTTITITVDENNS